MKIWWTIQTHSISSISKLIFIKEWLEVVEDIISISGKLKYQKLSASKSLNWFLEQKVNMTWLLSISHNRNKYNIHMSAKIISLTEHYIIISRIMYILMNLSYDYYGTMFYLVIIYFISPVMRKTSHFCVAFFMTVEAPSKM